MKNKECPMTHSRAGGGRLRHTPPFRGCVFSRSVLCGIRVSYYIKGPPTLTGGGGEVRLMPASGLEAAAATEDEKNSQDTATAVVIATACV